MILSDHVGRLEECSYEEKKDLLSIMQEWITIHEKSEDSRVDMIKDIDHMDFSAGSLFHWLYGSDYLNGALKAHAIVSREIVRLMHDTCK